MSFCADATPEVASGVVRRRLLLAALAVAPSRSDDAGPTRAGRPCAEGTVAKNIEASKPFARCWLEVGAAG